MLLYCHQLCWCCSCCCCCSVSHFVYRLFFLIFFFVLFFFCAPNRMQWMKIRFDVQLVFFIYASHVTIIYSISLLYLSINISYFITNVISFHAISFRVIMHQHHSLDFHSVLLKICSLFPSCLVQCLSHFHSYSSFFCIA